MNAYYVKVRESYKNRIGLSPQKNRKTSKKVKKSVDKRDFQWYHIQALSKRGAARRLNHKDFREKAADFEN